MAYTLEFKHPDIHENVKTKITGSLDTTDSTVQVANSNGFTADEYVLIGGYEHSKAEIALLNTTISSDTQLPLAAFPTFSHAQGEMVQQIYYNQIEIDYSTDLDTLWDSGLYSTLSEASDAATWSSLATIDITPSQRTTAYHDATSGRAYRARYKNEDNTEYSGYFFIRLSDGFEEFSVAAIARKAVNKTNKTISSNRGQVTEEFVYDELNACVRAVMSKRKRWSWNQRFNVTMDDITAGKNDYILPSNIEISATNRSMFNVRINDAQDLTYMDKKDYDVYFEDVHNSELSAELNTGSSTAQFDDTSNFSDSGEFTVTTGGTTDTVSYTANNRSTNTLTLGADTGVTVTHAIDTDVWQGANYGTPKFYTIFQGKMYFNVVPQTSLEGRTITVDFYKELTQVNSMDDYLPLPDPNVAMWWLCEAISVKANNKMDRYYNSKYEESLYDMQRLEVTGQKKYLAPNMRKYDITRRGRVHRIGRATNEGYF